MIQKCSRIRVLEVFFKEPTKIHFIKEISKRIKLAPTSVRKYIKEFLEEGLIKVREARPFNGYVANRDSEEFIFLKRVYNLLSIKDLRKELIETFYPEAIVLFGSFALGEDIEESDIDLVIITKGKKKRIDLSKYENELGRKIHLIVIDNLKRVNKNVRKKILNGIVIWGEING